MLDVSALDNSRYVLLTFSEALGQGADQPTHYQVLECEHQVYCGYDVPVVGAGIQGNQNSLELSRSVYGRYPVYYDLLVKNIPDAGGDILQAGGISFTTSPENLDAPKLALHASSSTGTTCWANDALSVSCSGFNSTGALDTPTTVYLVVVDPNASGRVEEASFAVDYDPGLAVEWSGCTVTEEPGNGWPAPGGGIHLDTPGLSLRGCGGMVTDLDPSAVGRVAFGAGSGFNPCAGTVDVQTTTWGRLKSQYGAP